MNNNSETRTFTSRARQDVNALPAAIRDYQITKSDNDRETIRETIRELINDAVGSLVGIADMLKIDLG